MLVSRQSALGVVARSHAIGAANNPTEIGQSLQEVIAEIETRGRHDVKPYPISELRVVPGRLRAGLAEYQLGDSAQKQLCQLFSIPGDYFQRLSPEIQAQVLQHHLDRRDYRGRRIGDGNSALLCRGGELVGIGRSDLVRLGAKAVFDSVAEGWGANADQLRARNMAVSAESFQIDLVTHSKSREVRAGDVLLAGLRVHHAFLGEEATTLESYALRLVCANGLVRMECQRRQTRSRPRTRRLPSNHPRAEMMQREQIRRLTAELAAQLDQNLGAIARLNNQPFDRAHMQRFLQQGRMYSQSFMDQVDDAWREEGQERTAYGALNALTRLATHEVSLSPRRRVGLERLAGMFAGHETRVCPHCLGAIRG